MKYQIAYMLTNQETIDRDFGNLLDIPDNFPKYVLTLDEIKETSTYKGIHKMHVKDFCLALSPAHELCAIDTEGREQRTFGREQGGE